MACEVEPLRLQNLTQHLVAGEEIDVAEGCRLFASMAGTVPRRVVRPNPYCLTARLSL